MWVPQNHNWQHHAFVSPWMLSAFCHLSVAPLGGKVGKSKKCHMEIDMEDSCILFPLSTGRNYTWYGGQEKHTPPH